MPKFSGPAKRGFTRMSRSRIVVPLVSLFAVFMVSAHAQSASSPPSSAPLTMHHFAGHPYHGHLAWEGGRWRHEVHDGRDGWWWDVGGVWYWYPERLEGPPGYISEDYADDVA